MGSQTRAVNNTVSSAWTNPNNAFALDGVCTSSGTAVQQNVYNFIASPFTIPANATIRGLAVQTYRASDDTDESYNIELQDSTLTYCLKNGTTGGSPACANVTAETLGNASDTWTGTWTAAHINSADFKVRLTQVKSAKQGTTFVDYIVVTVYFTTARLDSLNLRDAISFIRQLMSTRIDHTTLADIIATTISGVSGVQTIIDAINLSDYYTKMIVMTRSSIDSINAVDVMTHLWMATWTPVENLNLRDTVTWAWITGKTITDNLNVADTVSTTLTALVQEFSDLIIVKR